MSGDDFIILLVVSSPLLLVALGIGLWRHKFPSLRFAAAGLTTAVGGISVGSASAAALNYILSKTSPGFPGIGGAFIILGFYVVMSVVAGLVVGISFPANERTDK